LGHPAQPLDPARREVITAGGERVCYDDLLIAPTRSTQRRKI
jgi:NADPH-dependent 2,4-dienoyl-CoA reductase/sulfur reductase-like enzyme